MESLDLSDMNISPTIIAIMPKSLARESVMIPIADENGVVKIAMRDPFDYDTILKVQFILSRSIQPVRALEKQIVAAINRHYGQS